MYIIILTDTFEKGLVKNSEFDHGILASESREPLLEKVLNNIYY